MILSSESTFLSNNSSHLHNNNKNPNNLLHLNEQQYQHLLINETNLDNLNHQQFYNLLAHNNQNNIHQIDHHLLQQVVQSAATSNPVVAGAIECQNYLIKGPNNQNILIKATTTTTGGNASNSAINLIMANSSNSPSTSSSTSSSSGATTTTASIPLTNSTFQPSTPLVYNSFRLKENKKLLAKMNSKAKVYTTKNIYFEFRQIVYIAK